MRARCCLFLAITLLYAPQSFAIDCVKSFDQRCLSEEYNSEKTEVDYQQRQQDLDAHFRAVEKEEKIAEKEWQAEEKERKHQERLSVERRKAQAEEEQRNTLWSIDRHIQQLER